MEMSLKEAKMMLRYCKRALKFIKKMYKWKYIPLERPLSEMNQIENQIQWLEQDIKNAKKKRKS